MSNATVVKIVPAPQGGGNGAKDYLEHPDTPARTAAVAATREQLQGQSRHVVQETLMPYDELLPERLRGRNERIDEPFK